MRNNHLSINLTVSTYDEKGHLEPESKRSHKLALEEDLRAMHALWTMLKIADESRLSEIPYDTDVLKSFGQLGAGIADDAFSHLAELINER